MKAIFTCLLIFVSGIEAYNGAAQAKTMIYVTAVAWSNDASKIAAVGLEEGGAIGYIRIFDVATGETLYDQRPTASGFSSVAWSEDNRFIAVGSYRQTIWIIDVENRSHVATLWGHQATVTAVDWDTTGTRLVSSGNWDGLTILWDMTTYEQLQIVEAFNLFPLSVAFSPNNEQIAVGGEAGVRVYTLGNMELNPAWYFDSLNVGSVAWSNNGEYIAFGTQTFNSIAWGQRSTAARLYVIDASTGAEISSVATKEQTIFGLAWSPDDGLIATYSSDGIVKVWSTSSNTLLKTFPGTPLGPITYPQDVSFSPYGGRLAYGTTFDREQQTLEVGINDGVQIVVPDLSLERLQSIAAACNAPVSLTDALQLPVVETSVITILDANLNALPEGTIPPGCEADLRAVAEALSS